MSGDWRVQQGLSRPQSERWPVLRDEGDAKTLYLLEPEGEHNIKLKINLRNAQSSVHS